MDAAYVIVGAGQAGAWIAKTLRGDGFSGRIVLIGDENTAPYEHPPLSKDVLKGSAPPTSATVLSEDAARELGIELWLGDSVTAIDRAAHCVRCASGRELGYAKLFLATGSRVRVLPLPELPVERVFYLRSLADAERLRAALLAHARVLVAGGGWIGLEVAAVAREMGKQVDVVEMAPRLCARAVPPVISEYLRELHESRGVVVHTGAAARLAWNGSAIEARIDGMPPITADIVVVAVGIVPNVELASACGLSVDNGVVVDAHGHTSDPDILAAGDVTSHPNRHAGGRVRLESWDNAQNQAIAVAHAATGGNELYDVIPWFWSDQYDVNLQILGLPPADIEPQRRGDPLSGACLWFFWRGQAIASVIGVNAGRDIKVVRKWMRDGRFPRPDALLDASQKLQRLTLCQASGTGAAATAGGKPAGGA